MTGRAQFMGLAAGAQEHHHYYHQCHRQRYQRYGEAVAALLERGHMVALNERRRRRCLHLARFHCRAVGVLGGNVHLAVGAVFVADAVQGHGEVMERRQVDTAAAYIGAYG